MTSALRWLVSLLVIVACGDGVRPSTRPTDAGARRDASTDARSEDSPDDEREEDDDEDEETSATTTRDASRASGHDAGRPPRPQSDEDCSSASRLVYVLDEDGKLSSFKPDTLEFVDIGTLDCADTSMPFSMAVDRDGLAWVLYRSGQLHGVSIEDASCKPIMRAPGSGGFSIFGMGFVALDGDPDRDQLFIAGTPPLDLSFNLSTALGTIAPRTIETTRIGPLDGDTPELTGTGDGKLWAFYARDMPRRLNRIDPASGATVEPHTLSSIEGGGSDAYAIAFWGGDFWLFLRAVGEPSTTVYRVDGKTFETRPVLKNTGRGIVGAGVSTCAPVVVLI